MSSKKQIIINSETLLEKFNEEFSILKIFNDDLDKKSNETKKRYLTQAEKEKIVNDYFSRYFMSFFKGPFPIKNHFIFGKIKLIKKDGKPFIYWLNNKFDIFDSKFKMKFDNVDSNLISNLISNYERVYDVDSLENILFVKNKNK